MGLKTSKKHAMVLILILMIVTSLSIFIIGATKILTSSNEEYSINRNSTLNSSTNISYRQICYKDSSGFMQRKSVSYNADGSIKVLGLSSLAATHINNCEIDIPKGIKSFEITLVGGGGAGSASLRKYAYEDLNSKDCVKENIGVILKRINAKLSCTTKFKEGTCTGSYSYKNGGDFSAFLTKISMKEQSDGTFACNKSDGNIVLNPTENCKLTYKNSKNNKTEELSLNGYSLYNKPQEEIEQDNLAKLIGDKLVKGKKLITCTHEIPYYNVYIGNQGKAGNVVTTTINGAIFGSDKELTKGKGSTKIYIDPEDIGDGGKASNVIGKNTKGGDTKFVYYYKNASGYKKVTITAKGGNKGGYTEKNITSANQIANLESKDGVLPESLEIPSVFLSLTKDLYAGYYDSLTPKAATYFGASGASGYIDDLKVDKISSLCEYKEINGDTVPENEKCSEEQTKKSVQGTNGAPGMIMISW